MAACGVALGVCAVRLTRIEATGCVSATPDNSFVTTDVVSVSLNPVVEAGADTTLTGGCDCTIASYRGVDKLKRFEFAFVWPKIAPAAYEMMTGGGIISLGGAPVGVVWPTELECGDVQPAVAFEFWVKNWNNDAQDTTYPWIHHVYPQTLWQVADQEFSNDFANPTFNGFSRKNDCWGDGPYDDGPEAEGYTAADISTGAFWYAGDDPGLPNDTACDYADVTPAS